MKKYIVIILHFVCLSALAQIKQTKIIDEGGSGPYKAVAVSETSLPEFTVYRPGDLKAATETERKLPVMVFGNGACANTSISHERLLSEIASHGYIVIAIGALKMKNSPEWESTEAKMLLKALDWIEEASQHPEGEYHDRVDLIKVASAGQSCGGAQLMATAGDDRIKTYIMFNSGMGDMSMAGASPKSLKSLHGPTLYIVGGKEDIATENAILDYQRIDHVPVALANMLDGDHGGTFDERYSGPFAKVALKWLDWQLKKKTDTASFFLDKDLSSFENWTLQTKNLTR